jgi:DNA-binding PadR family transcriptional regulator
MKEHPTLLGYALLGFLEQQPRSGYDLRKIFALTPMLAYSDSPGAIYPALRRLEQGGWIRGRVENRAGLRRRKVFRPTPAGTEALSSWLGKPVSREDVIRGLEGLMLRFAFLDLVLGKEGAVQFLKQMNQELRSHVPTLREFLRTRSKDMPRSGRLALESGILGYEAQLEWTKQALAEYRRAGKE